MLAVPIVPTARIGPATGVGEVDETANEATAPTELLPVAENTVGAFPRPSATRTVLLIVPPTTLETNDVSDPSAVFDQTVVLPPVALGPR